MDGGWWLWARAGAGWRRCRAQLAVRCEAGAV